MLRLENIEKTGDIYEEMTTSAMTTSAMTTLSIASHVITYYHVHVYGHVIADVVIADAYGHVHVYGHVIANAYVLLGITEEKVNYDYGCHV